jgi:hypothetical protein
MQPTTGQQAKRLYRSASEIATGVELTNEASRKRTLDVSDESEEESDGSEGARRKRVKKAHEEWLKKKKREIKLRDKVTDKEE